MDASTRWETEAIRSGGPKRQSPPQPTKNQSRSDFTDNRHWVTLKEAEDATGIPTNTLRKWVRKASLPSYLEADGDLALRMVDLDAVIARAAELGREIVPKIEESDSELHASVPTSESEAQPSVPTSEDEPATMIVPVDAWNKMLNQLGNLHEAGQQLAEASERAAKAETESKFLREQLAERRSAESSRVKEATLSPDPEPPPEITPEVVDTASPPVEPDTTSYWRYLTSGWRDRKKRL
jgi:hypothetical protein